MKGKYIDGSGGEGTACTVEIDGEEYECMDCLGYGRPRGYKRGDVIYVRFAAGLVKTDRHGRAVLIENPDKRQAFENRGGWRYRAHGVLMGSAAHMTIDCGKVTVEIGWEIDESAVGTFVAIDIDRLDCWRARGPSRP